MGKSNLPKHLYLFHDTENNNLGAVGCEYLAHAQMRELQHI